MSNITLNPSQNNALEEIFSFLTNPTEIVFVLAGYSGTGKSTLVEYLLDAWPKRVQLQKLIQPSFVKREIVLTATTNKAAENLSFISGTEVKTIHSLLSLRVKRDVMTGKSNLVPSTTEKLDSHIIFIDEASYIDSNLLTLIFQGTTNCKIVFIGDPAQLTPVKSNKAPVFAAGFPGVELTQVVRQAEGNPIIDLSTKFRNSINSGIPFSFKPDGVVVKHVNQEEFFHTIDQEFTRPDWGYRDSKILGWTNSCVTYYNSEINHLIKGTPELKEGDYAICNKFVSIGRSAIKTDQMVHISKVVANDALYGVKGRTLVLDGGIPAFLPNCQKEAKKALQKARTDDNYAAAKQIDEEWVDLRPAYASTINKAQGSTYDRVYIDLNDIKKCTNREQISRMLYVGVSRARHQVVLTGDLC